LIDVIELLSRIALEAQDERKRSGMSFEGGGGMTDKEEKIEPALPEGFEMLKANR